MARWWLIRTAHASEWGDDMAAWREFAAAEPTLAEFGAGRFRDAGVAYLATITPDGGPRVHPISPFIVDGRLFTYMYPTSPKGHDLRRDPRYSLHGAVDDSTGAGGEFSVSGTAIAIEDDETWQAVIETLTREQSPIGRYVLFEFSIARASAIAYVDGATSVRRWRAP